MATDYRREARRVRGRWSHSPRRLHQELRDLAERHDSARPSPAPPPAAPGGPCQVFAAQVETRIEGPVLRHAQRKRLLASAAKLGIGRFEANLVIAAVQHARLSSPPPVQPKRSGRWGLRLVGMVVVVETILAWGAWHVFVA